MTLSSVGSPELVRSYLQNPLKFPIRCQRQLPQDVSARIGEPDASIGFYGLAEHIE